MIEHENGARRAEPQALDYDNGRTTELQNYRAAINNNFNKRADAVAALCLCFELLLVAELCLVSVSLRLARSFAFVLFLL